jgi:hypothetical protein
MLLASTIQPINHDQADIGSNINATVYKSLLENCTPLAQPFNLLGTDASVDGMMCPGYGYFPLQFLQGSVERILMYCCPQLSKRVRVRLGPLFAMFDLHLMKFETVCLLLASPS